MTVYGSTGSGYVFAKQHGRQQYMWHPHLSWHVAYFERCKRSRAMASCVDLAFVANVVCAKLNLKNQPPQVTSLEVHSAALVSEPDRPSRLVVATELDQTIKLHPLASALSSVHARAGSKAHIRRVQRRSANAEVEGGALMPPGNALGSACSLPLARPLAQLSMPAVKLHAACWRSRTPRVRLLHARSKFEALASWRRSPCQTGRVAMWCPHAGVAQSRLRTCWLLPYVPKSRRTAKARCFGYHYLKRQLDVHGFQRRSDAKGRRLAVDGLGDPSEVAPKQIAVRTRIEKALTPAATWGQRRYQPLRAAKDGRFHAVHALCHVIAPRPCGFAWRRPLIVQMRHLQPFTGQAPIKFSTSLCLHAVSRFQIASRHRRQRNLTDQAVPWGVTATDLAVLSSHLQALAPLSCRALEMLRCMSHSTDGVVPFLDSIPGTCGNIFQCFSEAGRLPCQPENAFLLLSEASSAHALAHCSQELRGTGRCTAPGTHQAEALHFLRYKPYTALFATQLFNVACHQSVKDVALCSSRCSGAEKHLPVCWQKQPVIRESLTPQPHSLRTVLLRAKVVRKPAGASDARERAAQYCDLPRRWSEHGFGKPFSCSGAQLSSSAVSLMTPAVVLRSLLTMEPQAAPSVIFQMLLVQCRDFGLPLDNPGFASRLPTATSCWELGAAWEQKVQLKVTGRGRCTSPGCGSRLRTTASCWGLRAALFPWRLRKVQQKVVGRCTSPSFLQPPGQRDVAPAPSLTSFKTLAATLHTSQMLLTTARQRKAPQSSVPSLHHSHSVLTSLHMKDFCLRLCLAEHHGQGDYPVLLGRGSSSKLLVSEEGTPSARGLSLENFKEHGMPANRMLCLDVQMSFRGTRLRKLLK